MNPGRDMTSLMNIEKGDYIDPCWNEFLPEIKDRVLRRRTNPGPEEVILFHSPSTDSHWAKRNGKMLF